MNASVLSQAARQSEAEAEVGAGAEAGAGSGPPGALTVTSDQSKRWSLAQISALSSQGNDSMLFCTSGQPAPLASFKRFLSFHSLLCSSFFHPQPVAFNLLNCKAQDTLNQYHPINSSIIILALSSTLCQSNNPQDKRTSVNGREYCRRV